MKISIIAAMALDTSSSHSSSKNNDAHSAKSNVGHSAYRPLRLRRHFMRTKYHIIIGDNNSLPWNIPEDLRNFKRITMGHPIIMGRKTYDSIGKPLPGRFNIVISRNSNLLLPCAVARSLDEAIEIAKQKNPTEVFVIGGAQIYKEALPKADKMYITEVYIDVKGDARFPYFEVYSEKDILPDKWQETNRAPKILSKSNIRIQFVEYEKHKNG